MFDTMGAEAFAEHTRVELLATEERRAYNRNVAEGIVGPLPYLTIAFAARD